MWPQHIEPVRVFAALLTQWRMTPSGKLLGLDYAAIPPVLQLLGVRRSKWSALFDQLRIMEAAAVKEINA